MVSIQRFLILISVSGLLTLTVLVSETRAEKRVALVIGNSAYQHVSKLPNPVNDAAAITSLLQNSGFQVVETKRDVSNNAMRRAIRDFSDQVRDADIAVVYFAGHGIEVDGINYLIPVDAVMARDIDVEDETLSIDRVLRVLEPAKRLRLVILDACRDNPFITTMKRTLASRSIGRGLAKIEPATTDTLIAFAAKAGSTASDGDGTNSPFTAALMKHIAEPGLDLRLAFGRVRDEVLKNTNHKQEPFVYGSLGGSTVSLTPQRPVAVTPAPPPTDAQADMRRDYEFAAQIGTREAWESFLAVHTKGLYANLAKAALAKIQASEKAEAEAAAARARAEAAERQKTANAAAERAKAEKAEAAAAAAERDKIAATEKARSEAEKSRADASRTQVAALEGDQAAITRSLQSELRRVGCFAGSVDGNWSAGAQQALASFSRYAGMKLDGKTATQDAVDAVKTKTSRICPLTCERGFRAEGERCVAIACPAGQQLNDMGKCEKRPPKAAAKSEAPTREPRRTGESSGGEVVCNRSGCEKVKPGCRVQNVGNQLQFRNDTIVCN